MPFLYMNSDIVENTCFQMQSTAVSLQTTTRHLANTMQCLAYDWQGYSRDSFLGEMGPLLHRLDQLADEGLRLSQRLHREVAEWEQVGSQLAAGPTPAYWQAPLPLSAGGSASWLSSEYGGALLLPPLSVVSLLGEWSAQWPEWLKARLSQFLPFLQPPTSPTPPEPTGPTRLGELLDETPARPLSPETDPSSTPVSPSTQPISQPAPPTNGYPVPIKSQGSLGGNAACAPTSVSMILDYYHNLNSQNRAATPQELLTMLDKGDFTFGKGMSLNHITDELQELGYANVTAQANASLADLQTQLQQGPVITTVRLDMKSGQLTAVGAVVHAVVVKGLSGDGQTVYINDPWTGHEVQLPLADFTATWQGGSNGLYVIRP